MKVTKLSSVQNPTRCVDDGGGDDDTDVIGECDDWW
jgi:hypothetical protein